MDIFGFDLPYLCSRTSGGEIRYSPSAYEFSPSFVVDIIFVCDKFVVVVVVVVVIFPSLEFPVKFQIMALRRPPTRIELSVDDISEYNEVRFGRLLKCNEVFAVWPQYEYNPPSFLHAFCALIFSS